MKIEVTRFEKLKEAYDSCPDLGEIYRTLLSDPSMSLHDYVLQDGSLFRGARLCIPRTTVRDFLV